MQLFATRGQWCLHLSRLRLDRLLWNGSNNILSIPYIYIYIYIYIYMLKISKDLDYYLLLKLSFNTAFSENLPPTTLIHPLWLDCFVLFGNPAFPQISKWRFPCKGSLATDTFLGVFFHVLSPSSFSFFRPPLCKVHLCSQDREQYGCLEHHHIFALLLLSLKCPLPSFSSVSFCSSSSSHQHITFPENPFPSASSRWIHHSAFL